MSYNFIAYLISASRALSERREEVNRLNVFPVPDGDTGTNMSLTMDAVVKEVSALPLDATGAQIARAITHGSLMGARGNSGVITSQILRGLCEGAKGSTEFDAAAIDRALQSAVDFAFKAVRRPVEGTILTVLRDSAAASHTAAEQGLSLDDTLHSVATEAFASVERTPDLLPILKENGVVDSGAFGLAILFEAFANAVTGGTLDISDTLRTVAPKAMPKVEIEHIEDWKDSEFLYCTEFLLHSNRIDYSDTLKFLASMGDCELLVGERPDYKVHVHTNTPGTVLTYMTDRGQVSEVFIHNMKLQSDERTEGIARENAAVAASQHKRMGLVAVGSGVGVDRILVSLGVDVVVAGGQTMNPPIADLVEAVDSLDADSAILLPNNKNIIMTANAAVELANKPLGVVPTHNVTQGFAALICVNSEASLEDNVALMTKAAEDVGYGEVTYAIKDAKSSQGEGIHEGDFIGIVNGSLNVVGASVEEVTLGIIDELVDEDSDNLTMLAGEDLDEAAFDALIEKVEKRFPDLEIDAQRGEQPVYPVILSVE